LELLAADAVLLGQYTHALIRVLLVTELGLMKVLAGQAGLAPLLHRPLVPAVPLLHLPAPAEMKAVVNSRHSPELAAATGGTPVPAQVLAAATAESVTSAERLWHQKVGLAAAGEGGGGGQSGPADPAGPVCSCSSMLRACC
jgi:hypothetical protein